MRCDVASKLLRKRGDRLAVAACEVGLGVEAAVVGRCSRIRRKPVKRKAKEEKHEISLILLTESRAKGRKAIRTSWYSPFPYAPP